LGVSVIELTYGPLALTLRTPPHEAAMQYGALALSGAMGKALLPFSSVRAAPSAGTDGIWTSNVLIIWRSPPKHASARFAMVVADVCAAGRCWSTRWRWSGRRSPSP
jgi:hypothetical protein